MTSNICDEREDVGIAIPAAERRKTPVLGNGGYHRIVIVEGGIDGAVERGGDGTAKENGVDVVVVCVGLIFVKRQNDEGFVRYVGVIEEGSEEGAGPTGGEFNSGIMSIVCHVGGNEGPLWKSFGSNVRIEGDEVLDKGETGSV